MPEVLRRGWVLVVPLCEPWGANDDFAGHFAVVGDILHVGVHDADVDQGNGTSGLRPEVHFLVGNPAQHRCLEMRQAENRARLRHSVAGKDIDAARHGPQGEHLGESSASNHHGQATQICLGAPGGVEQHEQDRRHAMGEGHALVPDQLQEQIGNITPRIDLLGACGGRGVGEPPRMDMKHRGDRHVDAFAMKAALLGGHSEGRELADRVENHLPMAEIDALRRSGRPAGVKGRGLSVLVEIGKVELG